MQLNSGSDHFIAYFGQVEGNWPITVFETESGAIHFLQEHDPEGRKHRVWKGVIVLEDEMEVFEVPAELRPKSKIDQGYYERKLDISEQTVND